MTLVGQARVFGPLCPVARSRVGRQAGLGPSESGPGAGPGRIVGDVIVESGLSESGPAAGPA